MREERQLAEQDQSEALHAPPHHRTFYSTAVIRICIYIYIYTYNSTSRIDIEKTTLSTWLQKMSPNSAGAILLLFSALRDDIRKIIAKLLAERRSFRRVPRVRNAL